MTRRKTAIKQSAYLKIEGRLLFCGSNRKILSLQRNNFIAAERLQTTDCKIRRITQDNNNFAVKWNFSSVANLHKWEKLFNFAAIFN